MLGSQLPFGQAAELTGHFRMIDVSEATVRRTTERSGKAWVELQREAVEALETQYGRNPSLSDPMRYATICRVSMDEPGSCGSAVDTARSLINLGTGTVLVTLGGEG